MLWTHEIVSGDTGDFLGAQGFCTFENTKSVCASCVFTIGAVRGRVAVGSGLGVACFDGDQRGQVREGCFRDQVAVGLSVGQRGADSRGIVCSR